MTERSLGQNQPDDWSRGGYIAGEQYQGYETGQPGMANPGMEPPTAAVRHSAPRQTANSTGFLSALFDFSFTSFVTAKIIKVIYVLILIIVSLSALAFTFAAFTASPVLGFLTLVIGDPLFIIIVMAFWRLILEGFIVVFRIAEDIHALREAAGPGGGLPR